jgi:hypothetical protein
VTSVLVQSSERSPHDDPHWFGLMSSSRFKSSGDLIGGFRQSLSLGRKLHTVHEFTPIRGIFRNFPQIADAVSTDAALETLTDQIVRCHRTLLCQIFGNPRAGFVGPMQTQGIRRRIVNVRILKEIFRFLCLLINFQFLAEKTAVSKDFRTYIPIARGSSASLH